MRITPDTVNNSLLIYADQANYRIVETTLMQIDQPQLQVAIDATIAEVTLNNSLSYGVQSYLTGQNVGLRPNSGSILNTQATTAPATTTDATTGAASVAGSVTNAFINRAFPGFNFLIGSETQPSFILDALHAVTTVKVLSNPSLVVINNQVATLQVGDVVPVSTGSATVLTTSNTVVNTIDYRNTGIILRVAPRISVNGTVRLDIEQEISNVPPASANSLTPTVSERRVKSSISVATGQTVLLAGLISEQQNGARNTIPVLDQIPGLGDAFGHQTNSTQRTELIIFIRPQIIRDGSDAHTRRRGAAIEIARKHRHDEHKCPNHHQLPLTPVRWRGPRGAFAGAGLHAAGRPARHRGRARRARRRTRARHRGLQPRRLHPRRARALSFGRERKPAGARVARLHV